MRALRNQKGQGMIEYMILLAVVVLVCVTSTKTLGTKVNAKFKEINEHIESSIPVKLSP